MNNLHDTEAVDAFQQVVARIVKRLLEAKGTPQQEPQQQREEEEPCHTDE